jgi:flagella basal body P-ring formation protein FlgA
MIKESLVPLNFRYLEGLFPSIKFSQNAFSLISLYQFIQSNISLDKAFSIEKASLENHKKVLALKGVQNVLIEENISPGEKTYLLKIKDRTQKSQKIWITLLISQKVKVLTALVDIATNTPLQKDLFQFQEIKTAQNNLFFSNLKQISFYRLNRTLKKGSILKKALLTKKTLVSYGRPVTLLFKKANLTLKGSAMALKSGKIGDIIKVKNKRGKNIFGKVIGYDTISVKL